MLTVISWYSARKTRKQLYELVESALRDRPTLLGIISDHYTSERSLRPWAPLSERFGERLDVILAAEWPQDERERDGQALLHRMGASSDVARRLLRDQGKVRAALLLQKKRPAALIDLFFAEKGQPLAPTQADAREPGLRAEEDAIYPALDKLLSRAPAPQPQLQRALEAGEHDFAPTGLCLACGDGRASFRPCPGRKADDGPRRDRFELIEMD